MPNRCVVGRCESFPNKEKGILLHKIPFYGDPRPEAIRRRKRWVEFVKLTRAKWTDTAGSVICSRHFTPDNFKRRFYFIEGQGKPCMPRLVEDDLGCVGYPTILYPPPDSDEEENEEKGARVIVEQSSRKRRAGQ